jgi:hypothetical protein
VFERAAEIATGFDPPTRVGYLAPERSAQVARTVVAVADDAGYVLCGQRLAAV